MFIDKDAARPERGGWSREGTGFPLGNTMPRDLRAINGCSPATDRNFRPYKNSTPSCCHAVTRIILGNWIRILSFVNILANSSGVNEARLGRNAISGSFTIIGRLRHSRRIVSGRWSHFSQPSSAGCNAGLFREALHEVYIPRLSGGMPPLRLAFLEREGHCSLF